MYTNKLIEHKNDRPHGIVKINDDINISKLISLFVQIVNVILSIYIITSCIVIIICDIIIFIRNICYIHSLVIKWYVRIFSD